MPLRRDSEKRKPGLLYPYSFSTGKKSGILGSCCVLESPTWLGHRALCPLSCWGWQFTACSASSHPQDSTSLWHLGLGAGAWVFSSEIKQLGSQTNRQTNTITSSEVRACPTPRGKEATQRVTHFMFTVLVQCPSTGDAGLYLILICAGCFDLNPLVRGRKANIYVRHSRARDLHSLCYKSKCN